VSESEKAGVREREKRQLEDEEQEAILAAAAARRRSVVLCQSPLICHHSLDTTSNISCRQQLNWLPEKN